MSVQDKLNVQWVSKEQGDAVFQFRAIAQDAYINIQQSVSRIDALLASSKFTTVDSEIKVEGAAVRKVINDAKLLLDTHTAFLNWTQPKA